MKLQRYITERRGDFGLTEREGQELRQIMDVLEDNCKYFIREWEKAKIGRFLYRGSAQKSKTILSIKPRKNRYPKDMPSSLHEAFDEMFKAEYGWYARSEGIFCTSKKSMAKAYGQPNLFFPAGKYDYLWSSRIPDLYSEIEGTDLYYYDKYDYGDNFDFEDEWEDEYGKDSGEGSWSWQGDMYDSIDDIVEEIIEEDDDLSNDDWDNVKDEVIDEAEWIPGMSLDDYSRDKMDDKDEEIMDEIKRLVNSYQKDDLRSAIRSGNEVMFGCKKYYLVNTKYEDGLSKLLGVPAEDAMKQLKLFPSSRRRR